MTSSVAQRIRRGVFVGVGALVILGLGVYGPATLLGPLPPAEAHLLDVGAVASLSQPALLPSTGASGVTVAETAGAGAAAAPPASAVSTAGIDDPVPLGGTTKIITALVVLSTHPVAAGSPGDPVVITAEDYADYITYISESARAVSFITNESWTERDMVQAMLLGSSNNHANALARWGFGTMDAYLAAANAWLKTNGLTATTVADATGLSVDSLGTASDLTRIAALAFQTPVIAEIMAQSGATLNGNRQVQNLATYLPDAGVTGLSLSYTDDAALCLLYSASVPTVDASGAAAATTIYGAMLREPDYPTLEADMTALLGSASTGLKPTALTAEGTAYAEYRTGWGQTARAIARTTESRMLWAGATVERTVDVPILTTARGGSAAGAVTFTLPSGSVVVPLTLEGSLSDPGPLWRLAHPVELIGAFIASAG